MNAVARLFVVMFLWAVCFPLIALGIRYSPHFTFATLRALLAGLALLAVAWWRGRPFPKGWRAWGLLSAIGLGATTLGFLGMVHAAEFVSPGIATVIANTQPLLAAVLAHLFLRERLDGRARSGLVLGFIGIVLIAVPEFASGSQAAFAIGVGYITLAAIGITLSNVLIKYVARRIDALTAMGWQLVVGSVPLALAAMAFESPIQVSWTPEFLIVLFSLSFFGTALVYWLWYRVLEEMGLTHANSFSFLIPLFGLAMGTLFFGERIGWWDFFGAFLTLLGIAQVNRGKREQHS